MANNKNIFEIKGVTKSFPGVLAIDQVDLEIAEGEIHGIVGENGAGKSTLCNLLTGILSPDKGEIFYLGEKVRFTHPSDALHKGIRMVYQERNIVPYLSGAQNICLGEEPPGLFLDEDKILEMAKKLMKEFDVKIRLDIPVAYLSASWQQMIEILRGVFRKPKILILDEPTSSLTEGDAEGLFKLIKNLKKQGITVIYISHKLEEVLELCDRVTIMRDGKKIITKDAKDLDQMYCVQCIANRELKDMYPPVKVQAKKEKILEVVNLSDTDERVKKVSLDLHENELLGVYGLIGSGRTELAEAIFGLRPYVKGKIIFNGEELNKNMSTIDRIKNGILLTPEDRRKKGLFYEIFNLYKNVAIGHLDYLATPMVGILPNSAEKDQASKAVDAVQTKYTDIEQSIDELSGGNRQKVLLARWLSRPERKIMVMDEPTQGIDVGTKYELYLLFRRLVEEEGLSIIFISSELPEVMGICDRIVVFKEGKVSGELPRNEFNQEKIVSMAL